MYVNVNPFSAWIDGTERIKKNIMTMDPEHRYVYSKEAKRANQDIYDDLNKTLSPPWFL